MQRNLSVLISLNYLLLFLYNICQSLTQYPMALYPITIVFQVSQEEEHSPDFLVLQWLRLGASNARGVCWFNPWFGN